VSDAAPTPPASPARTGRPRLVAAAVCALEALVLAGFAAYYLVQLAGGSPDPTRVTTEAALIVLFAVGLAVLARLWLIGSGWAGTPTVVWHLLLVPVVVAMAQSGQPVVALALGAAVVLAIGATIQAREAS